MGDLKMARFILDVMTDDIRQVLDVIERDNFLSDNVTSISNIHSVQHRQDRPSIYKILSQYVGYCNPSELSKMRSEEILHSAFFRLKFIEY